MTERPDALVIGANIRGLVTAYLLDRLGYRTVLLEKAPRVGGADGSFVTPGGSRFDYGLHVLDFMRSEVATRLFCHVVDGRVHRTTLRRGVILEGHLMPYAPDRIEMPPPLASMLPPGPLVDDIGDRPPTRQAIAACYGRPFADLVFDRVLPSYPTEHRHAGFGVSESALLTNIYPWFFPRAERPSVTADESRAFHDKLRAGVVQEVLYPEEGGFGGFAEGFLKKLERATVVTGASDLEIDVARETHSVRRVQAGGVTYEAPRYFWAAAWPGLCRLLDLDCQDVATDQVLLGSFTLDRPAHGDYQEILVGDPDHRINRITFPARFRRSEDPLLQVEFAHPALDDRFPEDPAYWKRHWQESLTALGILDQDHQILDLDFRRFRMHFNAYGAEGAPLIDADPTLIRPESNIFPVVPSMANLNLNRYVPRVVRFVTSVL